MQTGDNAGAIADFRKVLEISPGMSESLRRPRRNAMARRNKAAPTVRARKIFAGGPCNGSRGSYVFRMTYAAEAAASAQYRKCCDRGRRRMPLFKGRFTMSGFGFFNKHRTWEDWFGMLLGVLIVVSPWFPFSSHDVIDAERSTMILNTFVVGMLVFGLAQLEYVALQRWEEVAEIALGLWLIASPFILGYSGDDLLRAWHIALGAIVGPAGCAPALAGLAFERSGTGQPSAVIPGRSRRHLRDRRARFLT
jgi:hypothetical protein